MDYLEFAVGVAIILMYIFAILLAYKPDGKS